MLSMAEDRGCRSREHRRVHSPVVAPNIAEGAAGDALPVVAESIVAESTQIGAISTNMEYSFLLVLILRWYFCDGI